jgi:2-iminobutanoate/2-iminopropanoate deaminase
VFRNLKAVLHGAGASMAHVVKLTTYLTRQQDVGTVVGIRRAQFAEEPPATTLVIVAGLANSDYLIEVEAVAVLG